MTRASSNPSDPILIAGAAATLAALVCAAPVGAVVLPPPVVQAPNSTSTDAPRASMRIFRMGPPTLSRLEELPGDGRPTLAHNRFGHRERLVLAGGAPGRPRRG